MEQVTRPGIQQQELDGLWRPKAASRVKKMVVIQAHKDTGTQLRYMAYCRGTRTTEQLAAARHTPRGT